MDNNFIQQLLMNAGGQMQASQNPAGSMQAVMGMKPQTGAEDVDLESALNDPEFQGLAKRQDNLDIRDQLEKFLGEDPGDHIQRKKQARIEAEKPKSKLGKFGNIMGEILAGLARAPESPNMARDRRIDREVRSEYDNFQQNAKEQLNYLRFNAKELNDQEKIKFQNQKLKLEDLARKRNIDLKEKDQDFMKRWKEQDAQLKREKLSEVERHNRRAEFYQQRYLSERFKDPTIKKYEEAVMRDVEKGLLTRDEAGKIIQAHYRNTKQPSSSKGVLPITVKRNKFGQIEGTSERTNVLPTVKSTTSEFLSTKDQ